MKTLRCIPVLSMIFVFSVNADSNGYQEWLKRKDTLRQDKSVARYYTFEDVTDSKSVVKDLSGNGGDLKFVPYTDRQTKQVFDDLQVVEGRWPEKKAVRLDRGFYHGKTYNIENKQFSAEVWFRRMGPGSILPASKYRDGHIISVSGYREGWRLATSYDPSSAIIYAIGGEGGSTKAGSNIRVDAAMPDNMWQHVAVTWDGKEMKLYLNGKQIAMNKFEKEYTPMERPDFFKVGFAELGLGSLIMDIDEIVIYNRALTPEEIEKLGSGPEGISAKDVFERADGFIKKGDYKSARAEYEKLKQLPNYGKELALFNIAESYRLEKDYAGARKTYDEIMRFDKLTVYYRIYCLLRQADVSLEQKDYAGARQFYNEVLKTKGALKHHIFNARLSVGDTYKAEKKYLQARGIYENLLIEEETSSFPNDGYRLDLRNRLEEIDGVADGTEVKDVRQKRTEWINSPQTSLYVSSSGSDTNSGTKEKPFATIKRAQEEVRKIKEKGLPAGGINVYVRGGRYFLTDSLIFDKEDSGRDDAPVVYRRYAGENVRLIGGKQVDNFRLLDEPDILKRLPEKARGMVWVADLKQAGITEYGQLVPRGYRCVAGRPGALEIIYKGKIMRLARWPNDGWERVADLSQVDGINKWRMQTEYQKGGFIYSGDRPERWTGEKDMWIKGYLGVNQPYMLSHAKIGSIDTAKKVINLLPDTLPGAHSYLAVVPVARNHPYFVYNIFSEIDVPGEFYLDRDTGKLYFYPPGDIKQSEVIATTLDKPIVVFNNASNIVLFGLLLEGTWRNAIEMRGGRNNLVAGSTIRNTGQYAVKIENGWNHKVVGCDLYDLGEGGVSLNGGDRTKLIPTRHTVENNHIYRFNRFCGGYRPALNITGIGQVVSHNVIHDSPMQGICFDENDHIIEFNEIHDVVHEGREISAIYIYGESTALMNRGTVIRNNFLHHITSQSSPNLTHGTGAIHFDAMNSGIVVDKNIFYRTPGAISSPYPGNYITNNICIDIEGTSISHSDRSNIFCVGQNIDAGPNLSTMAHLSVYHKRFRTKQPPWSYRYPPIFEIMKYQPAKWGKIQGCITERNVNTGGRFVSFSWGTRETTLFENNWDGQEPLFVDKDKMDFRIRTGAPVYGFTGCDPVDIKEIGVYKDDLRASWPINRTQEDIGRYFKTDWIAVKEMKTTMKVIKRVCPALTYNICPVKGPVTIDGEIKKEEWPDMEDKSKTLVIDRYYKEEDKKGPASYAWLQYDKDYLYLAVSHESDPWISEMSEDRKKHMPVVEIDIESSMGPHSQGWWMEDMPTGPIYILWGHFDGKMEVINNFIMPFNTVKDLEQSIEYRSHIIDEGNQVWTAEMKIPLGKIGINPSDVGQMAFNMGVSRRGGWFAWVPTGTSIWRLENAGFIRFLK